MKLKRLFIFVISLALTHNLSAQDITITAEAPQKVYERDYIILKYTINTEIKDYSPELTFPPELKIQFGPHAFKSKTIVSGVITHITTYSYNLLASQPGIYVLPPLTIDVNGQTYTSEALTVEVMKDDGTSNRDLFLEAKLSRPSVSVNQMVCYTVKLYTTGSTTGLTGGEMVPPAFDGFSVKQVMLPDPKFERVTYNGRTAYSCKLAEYSLLPEHPDTLTIDPYSVQFCVAKDSIEKIVTVQSPALRLAVEPPIGLRIAGMGNEEDSHFTATAKKRK